MGTALAVAPGRSGQSRYSARPRRPRGFRTAIDPGRPFRGIDLKATTSRIACTHFGVRPTPPQAGIAQFERDLISERVKSGLAAARTRGKKLGRQPGQRPKSDRLTPKVLHAIDGARSYRWIARDLGISKNTVADIVKWRVPSTFV